MSCNTKINTLNHFKKKGLISDTRRILDRTKFDESNKYYTEIARKVHGLNTGGKLIFDVEITEKTITRGDIIYERKEKIYRATPVEELFVKLDKLVIENNILEEEALRIITNREPITRKVNLGSKYSKDPVDHYTEGETYKSVSNKQKRVSNKGFISETEDKVFFEKMKNEYYSRIGRNFNIDNKTEDARKIQLSFYKFLSSKGIKGIEIYDSNNDLHLVEFNFKKPDIFSEDTIEESNRKEWKSTTPISPTETTVNLSNLEDLKWYNQEDIDNLYKRYTPAQINEMLSKDLNKAADTFNEYLYGNQINDESSISNKDVNDQIKKCK